MARQNRWDGELLCNFKCDPCFFVAVHAWLYLSLTRFVSCVIHEGSCFMRCDAYACQMAACFHVRVVSCFWLRVSCVMFHTHCRLFRDGVRVTLGLPCQMLHFCVVN